MLHEISRTTLKKLSLFLATLAIVAFLVHPSLAQQVQTIHKFQGQTENVNDGANPEAPLALGPDGSLYGTTQYGGIATCWDWEGEDYNCGALFRLTPPKAQGLPWTETILQSFGVAGSPGYWPTNSGLILDNAGNLYGTSPNGGPDTCGYQSCGAVFELVRPVEGGDILWTWKTIHTFGSGDDGYGPYAGLVFDSEGNLYGTTAWGGSQGQGAVYRLTPPTSANGAWSETVLYSFCSQANCSDGWAPEAPIVIDSKGNLFSTTDAGGTGSGEACVANDGCGTVFELSPPQVDGNPWTETVLYSFQGESDGDNPNGILFGHDGSLYGTTSQEGSSVCSGIGSCGTVFELSPPTRQGEPWTETTLYQFPGGEGGGRPVGNLVADAKGRLYGTTAEGGRTGCDRQNCGTVFGLAEDGGTWRESVLYRFVVASGFNPPAGLTLGKSGELYGTASEGGLRNCQADYNLVPCGTVFEITK